MSSNRKIVVVGVDIGTESTKVVVLEDDHDPEIVRNEVGGHTTPTVVSFDANNAKLRNVGAAANPNARHNTVLHLNRLLPGERDDSGVDAFEPFYQFCLVPEASSRSGASGCLVTDLDYNHKDDSPSDAKSSFSGSALLAMLFGNIHKNVLATLRRRKETVSGTDKAKPIDQEASAITFTTSNMTTKFVYSVACPSDMSPEAQQCMIDAVYAGVEPHDVVLVERGGAYKASYERKFPDLMNDKKQSIVIVDMGHAETTVVVLGNHADGDDGDNQEIVPPLTRLLSSVRSKSLGAGNVDVRLWEHFQSTVPHGRVIKKHSKAGQRLLAGTAELKHQLSQLTKASVTVENVGGAEGGCDLNLSATQRLLADLCRQVEIPKLVSLLEIALQEAGITGASAYDRRIDSIELVGGGCRIPFVKETIEKVLKEIAGESISFSYAMDDASAALGAALVAEDFLKIRSTGDDSSIVESILARECFSTTMEPSGIQAALRCEEQNMTALDEKMQQRASTLNLLETRILELRSAGRGSTHGYLLPDELFVYLDEVENWLFMGPAEEASNSDVIAKWEEIKKRTGELIEPYQQAIDDEQKAKEAELEAEARQAELARAFDDEVANEPTDHDNRRLSKKRRMEIVMKIIKEGGKLFESGDYSK